MSTMICEECERPITDSEGYRHEGLGFVHKHCPDDGDDLLCVNCDGPILDSQQYYLLHGSADLAHTRCPED